MSDVMLSRSAVFEPLVNRWHAMWVNVAPLTGLLDIAYHQLPALKSYLEAPELHFESSNLYEGSAFMGVPPSHAPEVEMLLAVGTARFAAIAPILKQLRDVEKWLLMNATGAELSAAYQRVPSVLRPFTELAYDYHARASLRVDEGSLYRSSVYAKDVQTTSVFELASDWDRKYVVSTPRLPSQDLVEVRTPWNDPAWARVFELDTHAMSRDQAIARLAEVGIADHADRLLAPSPAPRATAESDRVEVTYFGHATVLFTYRGQTILFDPVLSSVPTAEHLPRLTYADLPPVIDTVVITHAHIDHFSVETLWRLRGRVRRLIVPRHLGVAWADVSLRRVAEHLGYRAVIEVAAGDSIELTDGEILALPFWGEHGDVLHGSKCTYAVRFGSDVHLLLIDSQPLVPDAYAELLRDLGRIRSIWLNTETEGAALGWTYEAILPEKRNRTKEATRKCRGPNVEECVDLFERLRPDTMFNYALGVEPWISLLTGVLSTPAPDSPKLENSRRMIEAVKARGGVARRLLAGERFSL